MRCLLPFALAGLVALAGCASLDPHSSAPASARLGQSSPADQADAALSQCARLLEQADRLVDAAGVRDAQEPRVPGYPYLRADRLSEALAARAEGEAAFADWTARLAALDDAARRIELANLAGTGVVAPGVRVPGADELQACRARLLAADAATPAARDALRAAARVPPDYLVSRRALGLYPLTRLPFARGVRNWQAQTRAVFATPPDALPVRGRMVHYRLGGGHRRPDAEDVRAILERSRPDALGVPRISREDRNALFAAFAPEILVDEASYDDRIGSVEHAADGGLWVNFFRPTVYTRVSHAIVEGRVAVQLNYVFWFAARPPESAVDLLAGRFDAVIWRVTLDRYGLPSVYDTIHHCGCYHLFFPVDGVRARPQPDTIEEGLFSPQSLAAHSASNRIGVRLSAGAHYIERVLVDPRFGGEIRPYVFADDNDLRSLPVFTATHADGSPVRRSVFDRAGFVPGSERGERFLFWPMGIANAGALRQWGRHATAFVGMRHFDDPNLMNSYFVLP